MKSIQSNIKKAKKYLDNNHCVAVPTETVYGLAANAYSNSAVKKIFSLKKRPCLLYTSPSPRDPKTSRMPSSA